MEHGHNFNNLSGSDTESNRIYVRRHIIRNTTTILETVIY